MKMKKAVRKMEKKRMRSFRRSGESMSSQRSTSLSASLRLYAL
jgi:hypothetical protein